jgi:uncharacterized protein with von Willebrand factor type A (vWA) domain
MQSLQLLQKTELHRLVVDIVKLLLEKDVPVVILANKSDVAGALDRDTLVRRLQLDSLPLSKLQIFSCSVLRGTGYDDAFAWLADALESS